MAQHSLDQFQRLSAEEVTLIYSFLDPTSLWRFGATNKQLFSFRDLTSEQWRQKYAKKYSLNDNELACYDLDWPALYINRFLKETKYIQEIEAAIKKQKEENQNASNTPDPTSSTNDTCETTAQTKHVVANKDNANQYENMSDFLLNLPEDSSGITDMNDVSVHEDGSDNEVNADELNGNYNDNDNDEMNDSDNDEMNNEDNDWWDGQECAEQEYNGIHATFKFAFDRKEYKPQFNPFYCLLTNPPTDIKQIEAVIKLIYYGLELGSRQYLLDTLVTFLVKNMKHPELMQHLHMFKLGKYMYNFHTYFPDTKVALGSLSLMTDHLTLESPYCGLVLENLTTMVDNSFGRATFDYAVWNKLGIWDKVLSILKQKYPSTLDKEDEDDMAYNCMVVLLSNPIEHDALRRDAGLRKCFIDLMQKCPENKYRNLKMVKAAKYLYWPGEDNEELAQLVKVYLKNYYARPICIALEESAYNSKNAIQFLASNEEFVHIVSLVCNHNEKNTNQVLTLIRLILSDENGQEMYWKHKQISDLIEVFDFQLRAGKQYEEETDTTNFHIYCILRKINIMAMKKRDTNAVMKEILDMKLLKSSKQLSYETRHAQNMFWISYLDLAPVLTPQMTEELTKLSVSQLIQSDEEDANEGKKDEDNENNNESANENSEHEDDSEDGHPEAQTFSEISAAKLLIALIMLKSSSLDTKELRKVNEHATTLLKGLDVSTAQADMAPSLLAVLAHLVYFNIPQKHTPLINKLAELYHGSASTALRFNIVLFVSTFIHHTGVSLPQAEALIEDFVESAKNLTLNQALVAPKSIQLLFAAQPNHQAVLVFFNWISAHLTAVAKSL